MPRDPEAGIRILDDTLEYRDGSEKLLHRILAESEDRSSLSDELARKICDWPTRYHLSPQRANIVRPFDLRPGQRILEIGAGTGAITRYLGETGAEVTALEGNLDRARLAAMRCQDLENVEVICGTLDAYEDDNGFDLVCLIGVLEYAGCGDADSAYGTSFLDRAAGLMRPRGALLVAIENQIGLKYLLGYEEDHLGRPWAGIEGYDRGQGVKTFSRKTLCNLLSSCGLPDQTWFYPFPDYKLPRVILADAAFSETDAPVFVDQLVGKPVGDLSSERTLLCNDRLAHQVLLEAGLGRDVANSFLVVAQSEKGRSHPSIPEPTKLAWHFGDERRSLWNRYQVVEQARGGRKISSHPPGDCVSGRQRSWLRQQLAQHEDFFSGPTLESLALTACREGREGELKRVLLLWRGAIDPHRYARPEGFSETHPFSNSVGGDLLPPPFLDLCFANFVDANTGVEFIDREWVADGAVTARLVMARALWYLARTIVRSGESHLWSESLTVDRLAQELGRLCDLEIDNDLLQKWRNAETELLQLVTNVPAERIRADLEWSASLPFSSREIIDALPFTTTTKLVEKIQTELGSLAGERSELPRLKAELERAHLEAEEKGQELIAAHKTIHEIGSKLEKAGRSLNDLQNYNENLVAAQQTAESARAEIGQQLSESETKIGDLNREVAVTHGKLEDLGNKLEEIVRSHREIQEYNRKLIEIRKSLESSQAKLEEDLASERTRGDELGKELVAAHELLEEVGKKLADTADSLHEVEDYNNDLVSAKTHLEDRVSRLETDLGHERAQRIQNSKELSIAQRDLEDQRRKSEEAEEALKLNLRALDRVNRRANIAGGLVEEMKNSLATMNYHFSTERTRLLATIASQKEASVRSIAEIEDRLADTDRQRTELKAAFDDAESRIDRMIKWRQNFENRLPIRLWRRIQRIFGLPPDDTF
jgi:2-polyprenyl-3-methyl-5-hydroxy-6-metoxy-1,4-benzoquinol methylase